MRVRAFLVTLIIFLAFDHFAVGQMNNGNLSPSIVRTALEKILQEGKWGHIDLMWMLNRIVILQTQSKPFEDECKKNLYRIGNDERLKKIWEKMDGLLETWVTSRHRDADDILQSVLRPVVYLGMPSDPLKPYLDRIISNPNRKKETVFLAQKVSTQVSISSDAQELGTGSENKISELIPCIKSLNAVEKLARSARIKEIRNRRLKGK